MTDDQAVPEPDPDEPPGWRVLDPDGNVVDSGPMTIAQADARVAEFIAQQQADASEGEQQ